MKIVWIYIALQLLLQDVMSTYWQNINGDEFWISNYRLRWTAARDDCVGKGGHLARFKDWYTAESVADIVDTVFWIDLNDRDTDDFVTSEGLEPTWTYWHDGEPNNKHSNGFCCANCVIYTVSDSSGWGMYDRRCSSEYYFVCQKEKRTTAQDEPTTLITYAPTTQEEDHLTSVYISAVQMRTTNGVQGTEPTPTQEAQEGNTGISGFSTGVIVGIAVAIAVAVTMVILVVFFVMRKHRRMKPNSKSVSGEDALVTETKLDSIKSANNNIYQPAYENVDLNDFLKNKVISDDRTESAGQIEAPWNPNTYPHQGVKVDHFKGPEGDYYALPSKNQITQEQGDPYSLAKDIYTDSSNGQYEQSASEETEIVDNAVYGLQQ